MEVQIWVALSMIAPFPFQRKAFAWHSSGLLLVEVCMISITTYKIFFFKSSRKVYGILMIQLSITVAFIALFVYHPAVKQYSRGHPEMQWIALALTFVLLIVLACCSDFRRRWPLNIILLGLFTLCEGFMLGSVASYYKVCF